MQVDHIVPQSAGGGDSLDNLCLACDRCNTAKSSFETGVDPLSASEAPLFNPRIHNWAEHFSWSEDGAMVVGHTAIGRATLDLLKMNLEKRQTMRLLWAKLGLHPPSESPRTFV